MSANTDPPYMVISSSQLRMWPWRLCLRGPANRNKVSKWVELKGLVSWGRYDRHICWCKLTDAILASLFLWSAALCRRRVEDTSVNDTEAQRVSGYNEGGFFSSSFNSSPLLQKLIWSFCLSGEQHSEYSHPSTGKLVCSCHSQHTEWPVGQAYWGPQCEDELRRIISNCDSCKATLEGSRLLLTGNLLMWRLYSLFVSKHQVSVQNCFLLSVIWTINRTLGVIFSSADMTESVHPLSVTLTCWQGGQNHSPSGINMRGGRRQAVWYPLSQESHSRI